MDDFAVPDDFFYPKYCILCLETNAASYVHIYSKEGTQLGIERVIVKHFWLQPNEENIKKRFICRDCWKIVNCFHKFYLRIESAHKLLQNQIPVVFCESTVEDPIGEKANIEIEKCEDSCVTLKKPRRGRPKTQKNEELLSNVESIGENVGISLNTLRETSTNSARRSDRLQKQKEVDKIIKIEYPVEEACGSIDEVPIKIEYDANSPDNHNEAYSDEAAEDDKEFIAEKSENLKKVDRRDEYIAEHFSLTCFICEKGFQKFIALKRHFRAEHEEQGYAVCCNKKLYKRHLLIDHIKSHQNPQAFKCPQCNKVLAVKRSYELHLKRHEEKRDRKYQCKICSKKYFNKDIYLRHMIVHAPDEQKTISCPDCEKKFVTQHLMIRHHKTVHLNFYAIICDVCGKSLCSKEAFERHMVEHSGIALPTHQCDICGVRVTSKYNLGTHKKRMHSEEGQKPQTCKICGKTSPTLNIHRYHMKYMHTMKRTHACSFCMKTFKRETNLKEHMTTHTGGVLYTCTYCPKTFNSNANMYAHRKRAHPKEWEENRLQKYPNFQISQKNAVI